MVVSAFEEWKPTEQSDLVCSGQAWHWIDPTLGFRHASEVLRPGGLLSLFWNSYGYDAPTAAVFERVVGSHAPNLLTDSVPFGTTSPDHAALDANMIRQSTQWFAEPQFLVFHYSRVQTVDRWLAESLTHSPVAMLTDDVRVVLLNHLREGLICLNDGNVAVDYTTRVTAAHRR